MEPKLVKWERHDVLIVNPGKAEVAIRTHGTPTEVLDAVIEAMAMQAQYPGDWDGDIVVRRGALPTQHDWNVRNIERCLADAQSGDPEESGAGDGDARSGDVPGPGAALPEQHGGSGGLRVVTDAEAAHDDPTSPGWPFTERTPNGVGWIERKLK